VGESARRHVFETRNVVEVTSVLAKFLAGEPEAPRRDNPVAA